MRLPHQQLLRRRQALRDNGVFPCVAFVPGMLDRFDVFHFEVGVGPHRPSTQTQKVNHTVRHWSAASLYRSLEAITVLLAGYFVLGRTMTGSLAKASPKPSACRSLPTDGSG